MVNQTKHVFYVGERAPDDSKKIKLDGYIIDPKKAKGTVFFLQGFSGRYDDYLEHFLFPIGEEFHVVTYNHRGHSGSQGKFNAKRGAEDWKEITESMGREPAYLLGHSYGANLATRLESDKIQSTYCLTPLFDLQMLPFLHRLSINILNTAGYIPGLLQTIDYGIESAGIAEKAGCPNNCPLQSFAQLAKLKETTSDKPMAFALADIDEVLGTRDNTARYLHLVNRIKARYPQAKNRSELVRGLNHCLNLTKNDFTPFLKPEKGKDSNRIIEDIINFYSNGSSAQGLYSPNGGT